MTKNSGYFFQAYCRFFQTCLIVLICISATSCGTMKVDETHYYSIPSKDSDNVNIFRLHITGKTVLSDAKYKSGWYPTNAVDSLFGNVTSNGDTGDLQARQEIETLYRGAMVQATKSYMAVALDSASTHAEIEDAMQVRRRVLYYPTLTEGGSGSSIIVDYNPSKSVAERHANDKLVFMLSANPDAVVGNITNFAESDKTSLAVSHLAQVMSQRVRNDVIADDVRDEIDRDAIYHQLERSIKALDLVKSAQSSSDKEEIQDQIKILSTFLEGVK